MLREEPCAGMDKGDILVQFRATSFNVLPYQLLELQLHEHSWKHTPIHIMFVGICWAIFMENMFK